MRRIVMGREVAVRILRRRTITRIVASCIVLSLSACSWWRKEPPAATDLPPAVPLMRSACPNSAEVWASSTFPRAAVARGLSEGQVTVKFRVDGRRVDIVEVTSTDSAFGDAAVAVVRRYDCAVDRPTTFEMAFAFRRG